MIKCLGIVMNYKTYIYCMFFLFLFRIPDIPWYSSASYRAMVFASPGWALMPWRMACGAWNQVVRVRGYWHEGRCFHPLAPGIVWDTWHVWGTRFTMTKGKFLGSKGKQNEDEWNGPNHVKPNASEHNLSQLDIEPFGAPQRSFL